jgi:hypothetical protein
VTAPRSRENLDRPVIGPALALPVSFVVARIDFNLDDPLHILDAIKSRHQQAEREPVFSRKLFAVHQKGQHHVILHGSRERNTVVVAVNGTKDHITRRFGVCAAVEKQLLERDATPGRCSQAIATGQRIDAHEGRDLIVGITVQNVAPPKRHRSFHRALDMDFPLFDVQIA